MVVIVVVVCTCRIGIVVVVVACTCRIGIVVVVVVCRIGVVEKSALRSLKERICSNKTGLLDSFEAFDSTRSGILSLSLRHLIFLKRYLRITHKTDVPQSVLLYNISRQVCSEVTT